MAETCNQTDPLDRQKIKELRKIRNKEKRTQKRLEKKLQPPQIKCNFNSTLKQVNETGRNVAIVTEQFYNDYQNTSTQSLEKTKDIKVNLHALIRDSAKPNTTQNINCKNTLKQGTYVGNKLDKAQAVLLKGKKSASPKAKKPTKLKKDIIESKANQPVDQNQISYMTNAITDELTSQIYEFVKQIVNLQEKYFKKDSTKATIKKRYIVGFHQLIKYLQLKKLKLCIIVTDLIVCENDPIHQLIEQVIDLAEANNIPHVFALKRRQLGHLTKKHLPISCIGILNYDSLNELYKLLLEEIARCKSLFEESKSTEQNTIIDVNDNLFNKLKQELVIK